LEVKAMKRGQREIYLEILQTPVPLPVEDVSKYMWTLAGNRETWLALCHVCKYARWEGFDCSEAILYCEHGLNEKYELWEPDDVWAESTDCWGFSPAYCIEDVADMVGLHLQGIWPDMQHCKPPPRGRPKKRQARMNLR
jgi:hypothetical protein